MPESSDPPQGLARQRSTRDADRRSRRSSPHTPASGQKCWQRCRKDSTAGTRSRSHTNVLPRAPESTARGDGVYTRWKEKIMLISELLMPELNEEIKKTRTTLER